MEKLQEVVFSKWEKIEEQEILQNLNLLKNEIEEWQEDKNNESILQELETAIVPTSPSPQNEEQEPKEEKMTLKKFFEWIFKIIKTIFTWVKKLFSFIFWFDEKQENKQEPKKEIEPPKKEETEKQANTEDIKEESKQEIFEQVKNLLLKQWIKIDWKEERIKRIILEKIQESTIKQTLIDEWKANYFELLVWAYETVVFTPSLILDLWQNDIIEIENIAISIAQNASDKIAIGFQSLTGQDIIPSLSWNMEFDEFNEQIWNIEFDKRILLLKIFYSQLWVLAGLAGWLASKSSLALIKIFESQTSSKNPFHFSNSPIANIQNTLEVIKPWESKKLASLVSALALTQKNYWLLEELKISKDKQAILEQIQKNKSDILRIKKSLSPFSLKNIWSVLSPSKNITRDLINQIYTISQTHEKLALSLVNKTFWKKYFEIKKLIDEWKIRNIQWKSVMYLNDTSDIKTLWNALKNLTPKIIWEFFGFLPMAVLGSALYTETQKQEWQRDLKKIFLSTLPFIWWIMLIKEGSMNIGKDWVTFAHTATAGIGGGLLLLDSYLLFRDWKKFWFFKGSFHSAFRVYIDSAKAIKWGSLRTWNFGRLLKSAIHKIPKKWRLGAVGLVAGLLSYLFFQ